MLDYVEVPQTIQAFFETNGQKLEYDKKQIFVRADDPQPWIYYLSEGIVEAAYSFDSGVERLLGYFVPHVIFSQNRLFHPEDEGDLRYTAIEKSTVLRIHRDVFLQQLATDHTFTREYLKNTLLMRIFTTDLVIYLGEGHIRNRCIRWLLLMAKYYGVPAKNGTEIIVPFTQDIVANFLHSSRESVSKTLREFIRSGHISITKKRITITDLAKLKSLLEY